MHRLAAELHSKIDRADGSSEDLIKLAGWNFEAQQFYKTNAIIEQGERVHTWCADRNGSGTATQSGTRMDEEMCFNFLYVTPSDDEG